MRVDTSSNQQIKGYYRYPTIHNDKIVFVAEDDLWLVALGGGIARRLTSNLGEVMYPFFSPDGNWLAFTGQEEGHPEVYVMPADGGFAKRMTWLGSSTLVVGWSGESIVFASNVGQPFIQLFYLYKVNRAGGDPELIQVGPARTISFGPTGLVIGRNTGDLARWKRYRGGTAGEIWIDKNNSGHFYPLIKLKGNLANPMWIGKRIYFISDHEGIGNIYSCLTSGTDLRRHTNHKEFYVRNATTDDKRIVYHAGADIYVFDTLNESTNCVEIKYHSPHIQRSRKFVEADKYLEDYSLSGDGSSVALVSRGKSFTFGNWEGPVLQQGVPDGVRYRLTRWLNDKKRVVLVSDESGEQKLEVHWVDGIKPKKSFNDLDIGIPYELLVSPKKDEVILANHRHELIWIDILTGKSKVIEQSKYGPIRGFDWSPDGRWVAYSFAINRQIEIIKICKLSTYKIFEVTEPVRYDIAPVFDPDGKYLYFLSNRVFNPVYDNIHFDLNFPKGMRPYLATLQKDLPSPFVPQPKGFGEEAEKEGPKKSEPKQVKIDIEGISDRIVPFPVDEGIYTDIVATKDKVFYGVYPVEGTRGMEWSKKEPPSKVCIKVYDMKKLEEATFVDKVTSFRLSRDGSALICRVGNRLRVLKTKRVPKEELPKDDKPSRESGWLDLARVKVSINPISEWQQMFHEAWRLQREYFWQKDMSGVNWKKVFNRYCPLVSRVASRSEFSDLIWEMQGELGTSHAYELGGDYRPSPQYKLGFLGADLVYDNKHNAYRFKHILRGDPWDENNPPPLKRPGVNVKDGDLLLAIGGQKVERGCPPNKLLVNQVDTELQLTVANSDGSSPRTVCVKTLKDETPLRYREWVESNRKYVHKKSNGKVGYLHIPDMMGDGYAEFHRYFLQELDREGLIVDVRFTRGGHVSQLLLEKLARKRLGYDLTRWMGYAPYPQESICGPVVALTNEYAASDGDIFSHSFKLMKLGKLIGRRTWGGVIGIWPRNWLVDGTLTTQPEFSFWFKDVGWGVENYGTDPDIKVDIKPQDYVKGVDTQLDRAIKEVLRELEKNPPLKPDFRKKPKLTLP
ncbi:MAG: PDZ domain-containing protein [bacterium]|nr:PDZ domain-containing protein [bacterium]